MNLRIVLFVEAGLSLFIQGCGDSTGTTLLPGTPPVTTVAFSVNLHLSPRIDLVSEPPSSWSPVIHFTNDGATTLTAAYGGCSVAVWLYHADAHSGIPAWDNRMPANNGCFSTGYILVVPPGSEFDLNGGTYNRAVIGDSLPSGEYKVVLAIRPDTPPNAALITFQAGKISLP
jgi:hypothetical protein